MDDKLTLTETEWSILEVLWERSPRTGREIVEAMANKIGWNRSTTLTMLTRMENKGAIKSTSEGKKQYFPAFSREDAAHRETESFLEKVYHGSVKLMVCAMTQKQALSKEEISELYAMLKELEGDDSHG